MIALLLALAVAGPVAEAQDCIGGREITDATAGRCCWPAQAWSAELARCEGPPRCPAGRAAHGDDCVPSDVPTDVPAETPTEVSAPAVPAHDWPHADRAPTVAINPAYMHVPEGGLIQPGMMSLVLANIASTVVGVALLFGGGDRTCPNWSAALSFFPLVGSALAIIPEYACHPGWGDQSGFPLWAIDVVLSVHQIVGLVLVIAGRHARTEIVSQTRADAGLGWRF